jgi:large subunit ribosomal protein L18
MSDYLKKKTQQKRVRRQRAHFRVRNRVKGTAERPRLAVFKSSRYIYAQLIDDERGHTLAQASSMEAALGGEAASKSQGNKNAAKRVGEAIAERAKSLGLAKVVFDRGGYIYHGKVKAVADGAREKGLQF